jgi:hypothetical protein
VNEITALAVSNTKQIKTKSSTTFLYIPLLQGKNITKVCPPVRMSLATTFGFSCHLRTINLFMPDNAYRAKESQPV